MKNKTVTVTSILMLMSVTFTIAFLLGGIIISSIPVSNDETLLDISSDLIESKKECEAIYVKKCELIWHYKVIE